MSLSEKRPAQLVSADRLADAIIARVGKTIVLAMPLGLGKANHVANASYPDSRVAVCAGPRMP